MSPNVKAAMKAWTGPRLSDVEVDAALMRAADILEQTVPQVDSRDSRNILYEMPAGLKWRLTTEIADALREVS